MFKKLEKLVKNILISVGLKKKKKTKALELWLGDKEFESRYEQLKGKTLVTKDRCFMIYQLAKYASSKEGDFAEVGVYKGGTAHMVAHACPGKKIYLFDTFEGMPEVDDVIDLHKKGEFADTSLEAVQAFLKGCKNVEFSKGFFSQTAGILENARFSFFHCDVDIYPSVKDCLEFFYPKMVSGGVMVFDDYDWKDTPGVKKAISEFLSDKPEVPVITTQYQCAIIKH